MPLASFLSVLTGMVLKAVRTWRVSNNSTARPAFAIAACSHWDSGPASRPIRSTGAARPWNQAIRAVDNADAGGFQRYIDPGMLHGRLSMMLGAGPILTPLLMTPSF